MGSIASESRCIVRGVVASLVLVGGVFVVAPKAAGQRVQANATASLPGPAKTADGEELLVLAPGSATELAEPDVVDGKTVTYPLFTPFANGAFKGTERLNAFAIAWGPLDRANVSCFQYHEFAIAGSDVLGAGPDSVITAQIAGSAELNGFLFAMGGTSADASLDLKLLDVTVDPEDPVLVCSQNITSYAVSCNVTGSVGGEFDIAAEGGFPYVGVHAGSGISASIDIQPQLQIVRDEVDFAFTALLRRGRTYRLQFELSETAQNRIFGGTSIASFYSPLPGDGSPVIPNPLDPETSNEPGAQNSWLSILLPKMGLGAEGGSTGNLTVRKGDSDLIASTSFFGSAKTIWEQNGIGANWNVLDDDEKSKQFSGASFAQKLFGNDAPLNVKKLLLDSPVFKLVNNPGRDVIEFPGVELSGVSLLLQQDAADLENRSSNRDIEQALLSGRRVATLCLPQAHGGELERVMAVVADLIARSQAAGLGTGQATFFQAHATQAAAAGDYRIAYDFLVKAYKQVAEPDKS